MKIGYSKDFPGTTLNFPDGEELPAEYTDIPPLEGTLYQSFNEELQVWELDAEKEKESKIAEIDRKLEALDREYLTVRILSGIGMGDEYAIDMRNKHEELAEPLRKQRKALEQAIKKDEEIEE